MQSSSNCAVNHTIIGQVKGGGDRLASSVPMMIEDDDPAAAPADQGDAAAHYGGGSDHDSVEELQQGEADHDDQEVSALQEKMESMKKENELLRRSLSQMVGEYSALEARVNAIRGLKLGFSPSSSSSSSAAAAAASSSSPPHADHRHRPIISNRIKDIDHHAMDPAGADLGLSSGPAADDLQVKKTKHIFSI
jgi:hypothetical protein